MGTWLWAIFLLNGQKAGSCGWMFRRVSVTGLTGQIFGCFLDYNNWTSAGEGVGAHVHSPCVYVGCALIPGGFTAPCPTPAGSLGPALLGLRVFFSPGENPHCSGTSWGWLSISPPCPRWVRSGSQEFAFKDSNR